MASPFGLAAFAEVWTLASPTLGVTDLISRVLLLAAAPIWDALLVTYFSKGWKGAQKDWSDPVLSPFLALVLIVPTLLAGELCAVNLGVGRILVTRDGNDTTA